MPTISVIMPVYNTDKQYLMDAIDSVLQQTFIDFEFLIIDDASTTDIKKIICLYNDPRIKYIRLSTNLGAANARNLGIKKAAGEFIAFLDSDDVALSQRFSTQIIFFGNNPTVDCVGSSVQIIPEGKTWHNKTLHNDIVQFLILEGCAFCQSSVMIRRKVLIENNIFYKNEYVPCEDYAFWLDLIGVCTFANIDEVLAKYRWHGNNISITQADKQKFAATSARIKKLHFLINCHDKNASNAFINFLEHPELFSLKELCVLETLTPNLVKKMSELGLDEQKVLYDLRKKYTKLIRKAPSKTIVRKLCFSSLTSYLQIGKPLQLFYYVAKGIF